MTKNCSNCIHWIKYRKQGLRSLCNIISGGNYAEVYTLGIDYCQNWIRDRENFKKFRDSIKIKRKII